jgi:dTMP kinase
MGIFITIEGIDGSGKTTVSGLVRNALEADGFSVDLIKEPTDTPLGKFIRSDILGANPLLNRMTDSASGNYKKSSGGKSLPSSSKYSGGNTFALAALFLFSADRVFHIDEIKTELNNCDIVICDRFIDSTYAYQAAFVDNCRGDENGELKNFIIGVNEFIIKQKDFSINRTYYLDLTPETAAYRLSGRTGKIDGFDSLPHGFFGSVRNNYLYLAERYKDRIKIIEASGMAENIAEEICGDIKKIAAAAYGSDVGGGSNG